LSRTNIYEEYIASIFRVGVVFLYKR